MTGAGPAAAGLLYDARPYRRCSAITRPFMYVCAAAACQYAPIARFTW
jgi:hypothetical protein